MAKTKGAIGKRALAQQYKAKLGGVLPLDYMLKVMRDDNQEPSRRDEMAKAAAPYIHAKLAAVEHKGEDGGPIRVVITRYSDA